MTNSKHKPLKWAAALFLLGLLWLAAMITPAIRSQPEGPPDHDANALQAHHQASTPHAPAPAAQPSIAKPPSAPSKGIQSPPRPRAATPTAAASSETGAANSEQQLIELENLNDIVERGDRDTWSRAAELELTTALTGLLGSHEGLGFLEDVACSAQACRARIGAPSAADPSSLVASVSSVLDSPGERYYALETRDMPRLTVFTARAGISLASASAAD